MSEDRKTITGRSLTLRRRQFVEGALALGIGATTGGLGAMLSPKSAFAEVAKPSQLTVRAWGGSWQKALDEGVSKPLSKMTGIRVTYDNTFDAEMRTKIAQAVAQKRTPPVSLTWDVSDEAATAALRGDCEDLTGLPNLSEMNESARPEGFAGLPFINMYTYVYVLAYVPSKFPSGAPNSWQALLDPKVKGRIGLYASGNGIIQIAAVAAGGKVADYPGNMEAGWKWVEKLKAQNPLNGKDEDFTKWFQQGEIDIACTILTNAKELKDKGGDIAWSVPKEGACAAHDCLWVPKGLSESEAYWAKQYINLAMSAPAQQTWCEGLGLPGLNKQFKVPAQFAGDPAYPTKPADFERLIMIPSKIVAANWDKWSLRYKSIMTR